MGFPKDFPYAFVPISFWFLPTCMSLSCYFIIMHQHPILTNKVSMEIFNLKVVNKNRLSKLFELKISNLNLVTVNGNKSVTDYKITCGYPAFFFNIKWVVCGCVDCFTVGSRNVQDFICFLDPNVENFFKLCFARFRIVWSNTVDYNQHKKNH